MKITKETIEKNTTWEAIAKDLCPDMLNAVYDFTNGLQLWSKQHAFSIEETAYLCEHTKQWMLEQIYLIKADTPTTWDYIKERMRADLNIGDSRARKLLTSFRAKYKGSKESIYTVRFSYNEDGQVVANCSLMGNKTKKITL